MSKPVLVTRSSLPPFEEFAEQIKPLWDTHWLTNMGEYHRKFESALKDYLEVPMFSLMVNGHLALEMALQAFDFAPGSEVITTPFTFISTTHAIVRNNLQPVFCDVHPENGTIDENKIEGLITEKTVAIMPVHVYGNVCNDGAIQKIAYKYGLKVIYDAAHAFGVKYNGTGIGNFGDASVFSFHATKVFNTIEGGGVAFSDQSLYEKLYNLKNFGIRGEELVVSVGANAKMNEFCAIMGLCNLKYVNDSIEKRKAVNDLYDTRLCNVPGIRCLLDHESIAANYAYYPIVFENAKKRNNVYEKLKEQGIHTRKYFYPLTSDQACFKNRYKDAQLDAARELAECVLALPIYDDLSEEDQQRVIDGIMNL